MKKYLLTVLLTTIILGPVCFFSGYMMSKDNIEKCALYHGELSSKLDILNKIKEMKESKSNKRSKLFEVKVDTVYIKNDNGKLIVEE